MTALWARRNRLARSPVTLIGLLLFSAACGGGSAAAHGNYRHPTEGLVSLSDDGTGFVDQSTAATQLERTPLTWTADGETITISFDNGNAVDAILRDTSLVFPPDSWSCCDDDAAVFEACTDCEAPPVDGDDDDEPVTEAGDGDHETSGAPGFGVPFTVGEMTITLEDPSVASDGTMSWLDVYLTAENQATQTQKVDTFLACGANFFTGKYLESVAAPTPRFPAREASEGFGIDAGEGWVSLTVPVTGAGDKVEGCATGIQLVVQVGFAGYESASVELDPGLVAELTR